MNVHIVAVVNGQDSEYSFSVNFNKSEYSKFDESGNIYESGKISSSVNLVLIQEQFFGSMSSLSRDHGKQLVPNMEFLTRSRSHPVVERS